MTYVIIRGDGLRGLGSTSTAPATQTPAQFAEQVQLAREALASLATIARVVENTTTSVQIQEAARLSVNFATVIGPRRLDTIAANPLDPKSVLGLASVQGATQRITEAIQPEVVPSVLQRFLLAVVLPVAGAFVTPEQLDEARESKNEIVDTVLDVLPRADKIPDWVPYLAVAFVAAYVLRTFR